MSATELAIGIFVGFGLLRILEYILHTVHDNQRRKAMKQDMEEMATDFIDKMHAEMEAEKAAEEAKKARRRKPATQGKGKIKGAATTKPVAKKGVTNVKAKARR